MVKAGLQAIYLSGWQVAADANLVGSHVSRPEPLSGDQRARAREAHQQRAPARGPDRARRGRRLDALARADRRRRRGRVRRSAERVRADEGVHRGRSRGRAFRGPARRRRRSAAISAARCSSPHRSSSARSSRRGWPPTSSTCRHSSSHARTPFGDAADERRRRARRRVLHRRADTRGLLSRPRRSRAAIARGLAYAPYADLVWFETSTPDLAEAEEFAGRDARAAPRQAARLQLLAVVQLARAPVRRADRHLPARSRAGSATASSSSRWRASTLSTWHVRARPRLPQEAMSAYVRLQEREFELEADGYTATRHQREVGAGYFDQVLETITGGAALDARAARVDRGRAIRTRKGARHERPRSPAART